jgi:hypothetical protein
MRIEIRPAFDAAVMRAELPIRKAATKTLRLLQSLDLPQLLSHPGLNFEKIHGLIDERSGEQLYSLRVTQSARALACLHEGPVLILVSFHAKHDETYRRGR